MPTPPSIFEITLRFAQFGLRGFGGMVAHGRHFFVEERGWLDEAAFVELFGVAQALPGANFVSVGIMLGDRFRGPAGSLAAVIGLCVPTLLLALALLTLAHATAHNALLAAAEAAIVAATAGQLIAIGFKIMQALLAAPSMATKKIIAAGIALATIVLTAAGIPLPIVVVSLLLASWLFEKMTRRA